MSSKAASVSASPQDSYSRGLQTGCLLGCSPLIFLFIVIALLLFRPGSSRDFFERRESAPETLPTVDASAPAERGLPTPPTVRQAPLYLGDDLSGVPEVSMEAAWKATTEEWRQRRAQVVAAALHLDSKEENGYLKLLLRHRPDLSGLPFLMGANCRTTGILARTFKNVASAVRRDGAPALLGQRHDPDAKERPKPEELHAAQLRVVSQVIPGEQPENQRSLIQGLSSIPRPEATAALARLAVYSPAESVRAAALEVLSIRRDEGATEVLRAGLSYPWPPVAHNAANAIVRLNRHDLVPDLEKTLAAPDPRLPKTVTTANQTELAVDEVVRINHHRNCLLCHAPAKRGETGNDALLAEIPVPTIPLTDSRQVYYNTESNLLVRIDVTYLRQDFSAMQQVNDWTTESWPALQRFDFLVRRRVLSPAEAAELRLRLAGESPYHRAAANALRLLSERAEAKRRGRS